MKKDNEQFIGKETSVTPEGLVGQGLVWRRL